MLNFSPTYNEQTDLGVEPVSYPYSVSNKSSWEHCDSGSDSEADGTDEKEKVHHDLACHYGVMGSEYSQIYNTTNLVVFFKYY